MSEISPVYLNGPLRPEYLDQPPPAGNSKEDIDLWIRETLDPKTSLHEIYYLLGATDPTAIQAHVDRVAAIVREGVKDAAAPADRVYEEELRGLDF